MLCAKCSRKPKRHRGYAILANWEQHYPPRADRTQPLGEKFQSEGIAEWKVTTGKKSE